ncbi:MAG: hypothetical protein ACRD5B_16750 [Nitrososphaeraceae archaeon]
MTTESATESVIIVPHITPRARSSFDIQSRGQNNQGTKANFHHRWRAKDACAVRGNDRHRKTKLGISYLLILLPVF